MPTVKELRDRLAAKGLSAKGLKAELEERLHGAENASEGGDRSPSQLSRSQSPAKKSGTGVGPSSPVHNLEASLKKGDALASIVFAPGADDRFQQLTIRCLTKLNALPGLLKPADADEHLDKLLEPVFAICTILASKTQSMAKDRLLEDSATMNFQTLKDQMSTGIRETVSEFRHALQEPLVREFVEIFTHDRYLGTQIGALPFLAHPFPQELEDMDMQRAIEASLQDLHEIAAKHADQCQSDIQQYYEEQRRMKASDAPAATEVTGTQMSAPVGDASQALGDLPSVADIVNDLPAEGMTFSELVWKLGIQHHQSINLQAFSVELQRHAYLEADKFLPPSVTVFPSDDEVRQTVAGKGLSGMDFLDLIKVLDVRRHGPEKVQAFKDSLSARSIVQYNDRGNLMVNWSSGALATPVKHTSGAQQDIFANRPVLTPTGFTPEQPLPSPGTASTSAPASPITVNLRKRLSKELARIKEGVLSHLRSWQDDFPRPLKPKFPMDFTPVELSKIRKAVLSHITDAGRIDAPGSRAETVTELVAMTDFPVPYGHTRDVLSLAVGDAYSSLKSEKKRATAKAALPLEGDQSTAGEAGGEGQCTGGKKRHRASGQPDASRKKTKDGNADSADEHGRTEEGGRNE